MSMTLKLILKKEKRGFLLTKRLLKSLFVKC